MAASAALLQGRCAVPRASRPEGTGVPPGPCPGAAGQLTDLGSRRVALARIKSWQLSPLRPVEDGDLDALFDQMRDPQSVWIAAFTADDPYARAANDNAVSLRVPKKAGFQAV